MKVGLENVQMFYTSTLFRNP